MYSKTDGMGWLLWRVERDKWHEVAPMSCRVRQMASGGSYEVYSKTDGMGWLLWKVECDRWHEVAAMVCIVQQMASGGSYGG